MAFSRKYNYEDTVLASRKEKGNAVLQAGTPVERLVEVEAKADADYVIRGPDSCQLLL